jgi:4-hydroxy-tetrahydrodipicolinate reductase
MWGLPLVVGTTGWHEHLPRVARWVDQGGGAVLHAANFSVGVSLVRLALQGLMPLLDRLPEYDAFILEVLHTGKVDSPSGTAHLAYLDPKSGEPTRIGFRMDGDKKVRFAKKSGETING